MERCATCKYFEPNPDNPYGSCDRWNTGYRYDKSKMPLNEVLVESDEGWCMEMGPDFGCILHEPKA